MGPIRMQLVVAPSGEFAAMGRVLGAVRSVISLILLARAVAIRPVGVEPPFALLELDAHDVPLAPGLLHGQVVGAALGIGTPARDEDLPLPSIAVGIAGAMSLLRRGALLSFARCASDRRADAAFYRMRAILAEARIATLAAGTARDDRPVAQHVVLEHAAAFPVMAPAARAQVLADPGGGEQLLAPASRRERIQTPTSLDGDHSRAPAFGGEQVLLLGRLLSVPALLDQLAGVLDDRPLALGFAMHPPRDALGVAQL